MKRIWLRLSLALLILATVALAGCKNAYVPPHEFDGGWSGPFFQVWNFTSSGGTYAYAFYNFDFT